MIEIRKKLYKTQKMVECFYDVVYYKEKKKKMDVMVSEDCVCVHSGERVRRGLH